MPPFLFTSLSLFGIWLAFLLVSKNTRKEQIIMSIVGLVLTPATLFIASISSEQISNQASISVGIEDLIFSFSIFGIAAIVYHVLLGKHTHKLKNKHTHHHLKKVYWVLNLILMISIWAFIALLLMNVFQMVLIQSMIVGGLLVTTFIIAERHDLLLDSLLSGIFIAILVFVIEQLFFLRMFPDAIAHVAPWNVVTTFLIGGIPLEELIWSAVIGFTIGPMYEWLRRLEFR